MSVMLPHEVLHALATARDAKIVFDSIMLGNRQPLEIESFWKHIRTLPPWRKHPDLQNESQDWGRLVALQFHADGAEIYRDDEHFIYSFSSLFAGGLITDVMLYRFPFLLVPERHMQQPEATPPLSEKFFFSLKCLGFSKVNLEVKVDVLVR